MSEKTEKRIIYKIEFDLCDDKDAQILALINEMTQKLNAKDYGRKIKRAEVIKEMLGPLKPGQIRSLQSSTLDTSQRLKMWLESYNKIHNTDYNKDQFAVEIIPKLKEKDIEKLDETLFSFNKNSSEVPLEIP